MGLITDKGGQRWEGWIVDYNRGDDIQRLSGWRAVRRSRVKLIDIIELLKGAGGNR